MQVQTLETSISNELVEGEQLLWSGRPEPGGKSITSPARVFLIIGLIYFPLGLLLVALGLILLFAVPGAANSGGYLGALIPGGVFFIIGLVFLIIGLVARFPTKNTSYAITDRRVIILRSGRYLRAISYHKRAITQVQRLERPDGSGDLIFSGTALPYGNYYNNANYNTASSNRQGAFTAIANVHFVEQRLLSMLNND
jgi:hypothetical protein